MHKQRSQTVRNTLKDQIMAFIPNPFSIFSGWKDLIILSLCLKYNRRQVELMYADFIVVYYHIIHLLNKENKQPQILFDYEKNLLQRLGKNLQQQQDIEYWVEKIRIALQRIIQMLISPQRLILCRHWSRADLLTEIRNGNHHSQCTLELERWLYSQVEKNLVSSKHSPQELRLRILEMRCLRRRYKLQKKLSHRLI